MTDLPSLALFQSRHPELFALLESEGWRAKETPENASETLWELPDRYFSPNVPRMVFMIELSGICLRVDQGTQDERYIRFGCTNTLASMSRNDNFEMDVYRILGTYDQPGVPDGYPVAEGPGAVLFVREDYLSAFVDHSLCGFFRAPDPFIILDWYLLGIRSPLLEHRAVHQGDRIARHL